MAQEETYEVRHGLSLRVKLFFASFSLVLAASLVQAFYLTSEYNAYLEDQFLESAKNLTAHLRDNAKVSLVAEDVTSLKDIATLNGENKDIVYIKFSSPSGRALGDYFQESRLENTLGQPQNVPKQEAHITVEQKSFLGTEPVYEMVAVAMRERIDAATMEGMLPGGQLFEVFETPKPGEENTEPEENSELDNLIQEGDFGDFEVTTPPTPAPEPAPAPEAPAPAPSQPAPEFNLEGMDFDNELMQGGGNNTINLQLGLAPNVFVTQTNVPKSERQFEVAGIVQVGYTMTHLNERTREINTRNWAMVVSIAIVIGVSIFFLTWRLTQPLKVLLSGARAMASGDLTQKVIVNASDDIGELAEMFNRMGVNLRDIVLNIRSAAAEVQDVTGKLSQSATLVLEGSKDQNATNADMGASVFAFNNAIRSIGERTNALNQLAQESSSSTVEMSMSIEQVDSSMETLGGSVDATSTSIEEMTYSIKQVSENVEVLSSEAQETATSMTQIEQSVRQVEANAHEANKLSIEVREAADRGMDRVTQTQEGMNQIRQTTEEVGSVIKSLEKSTQEIGKILTVITDIADETNLLALNASIIAAQAGQEGKSFGVVAENIKLLSDQTNDSAKDIATRIKTLQRESTAAIDAMGRGQASVEHGELLASQAGEALRVILDSANLTSVKVAEIARATVEQAKGTASATRAIDQIAEMAAQISRATVEQKQGSDQVSQVSEQMRAIAEQVRNSTREQALGSRQITESIERMTHMVEEINRSTQEQSESSEQLVSLMDDIKERTNANLETASQLGAAIEVLSRQSENLMAQLERFKV